MDAYKEQVVLQMFDGRLPIKAICAELDVSDSQVRDVLKSHGRKLDSTPGPKARTADEASIIADYQQDVRVPEILAKHNIGYSRLYTILNAAKIPLRQAQATEGREAALEQALKMYQEGQPLWKIQEETGVAQPRLHAELHARNIPLRRPRK